MNKYHINVFLKNDNYMCKIGDSKKLDMLEYWIRFKGIFDSVQMGLEYIHKTYGGILKDNNLQLEDISSSMSIVRINTNQCTRYPEMFISQV